MTQNSVYENVTAKNADLSCFIDIEDKFAGVTAEEDDDNGEEESNHCCVSAVASADPVVELGGSVRNIIVWNFSQQFLLNSYLKTNIRII